MVCHIEKDHPKPVVDLTASPIHPADEEERTVDLTASQHRKNDKEEHAMDLTASPDSAYQNSEFSSSAP